MEEIKEKTLTALFSGRVQGVGFRAYVANIAQNYTICGWVKNLPDGRVELVAWGKEGELQKFFSEICQGKLGKNIQRVHSNISDAACNTNIKPQNFLIK